MKVRTCQAKKESYSFTQTAAAQNKSSVKIDLDDFKASTASSSPGIGKRSITLTASAPEIDVITAVTNLLNQYDAYNQQLNYSIVKVDNMSRNFEQEMTATTSKIKISGLFLIVNIVKLSFKYF